MPLPDISDPVSNTEDLAKYRQSPAKALLVNIDHLIFLMLGVLLGAGICVSSWFYFSPIKDPVGGTATNQDLQPTPPLLLPTNPPEQVVESAERPPSFEFYDSSVWLSPDFNWEKVPPTQQQLGKQAVVVNGKDISYLSVDLAGTEWKTTPSAQDPQPLFADNDSTRLESLGWSDSSIKIDGYSLLPIIADGPQGSAQGYIRTKEGQIQVLVKSSGTVNNKTERRVFLSNAVTFDELTGKMATDSAQPSR